MLEDVEEVSGAIHVLTGGFVVDVMLASSGIHEDRIGFAGGLAKVFDDLSFNTGRELLFVESASEGIDIEAGLESLLEVKGLAALGTDGIAVEGVAFGDVLSFLNAILKRFEEGFAG